MEKADEILQAQLKSLDDTDLYATAWQQARQRYYASRQGTSDDGDNDKNRGGCGAFKWGGRGQGGRGTSRRTFQLLDIVVKDTVRLEYLAGSSTSLSSSAAAAGTTSKQSASASSSSTASSSGLLLDGATLKLLSGRVYALIGPNGSGKSTLLKRLHANRIPGVPPWIRTLHVGQEEEALLTSDASRSGNSGESSEPSSSTKMMTPISYLEQRYRSHSASSTTRVQNSLDELEARLEALQIEQDPELFERLSEKISALEDQQLEERDEGEETYGANPGSQLRDALALMGVPSILWDRSLAALSPGMRQKVCLSAALICRCDLLLLDEPSKDLDVIGLIQLRALIEEASARRSTTVLMVSHDLDLVNDVATDVVQVQNRKLYYVPGNYDDYLAYRRQIDIRDLRQVVALEKKREHMHQTLENLKQQPVPRRGGARKKSQQISAHRKKMEQQGIVATAGEAGKSLRIGVASTTATLAMESSARRGLTTAQLLELMEQRKRPPPDKAVQFMFRNPASTWGGEPLILATDVGHRYPPRKHEVLASVPSAGVMETTDSHEERGKANQDRFAPPPPKAGYALDSVDLRIEEGETYCILGESMSGKSTLLQILAKRVEPTEGKVEHAAGVDVGILDPQAVEKITEFDSNPLSFLSQRYPTKSEKEIRGELTNFGLSPQQALTSLRFLSGGERRRLCLASLMLGDPQVMLLDQPSSDLDMESVEALIYGLKRWKGTLVMVTHDSSFVRELEANCYALVNHRLYRVEGGIDAYLRFFGEAKG
jgi:ATPase subunit of ABC transporter with duplicated ATPase domains